jgi:hypothetical protein
MMSMNVIMFGRVCVTPDITITTAVAIEKHAKLIREYVCSECVRWWDRLVGRMEALTAMLACAAERRDAALCSL